MNEEKTEKLGEIHDRVEELIYEITRKCVIMFPGDYEDIAKKIIKDNEQIVQDKEILAWVRELRELEKLSAEDNVWTTFLNPEIEI